jgi:hypothetical protein
MNTLTLAANGMIFTEPETEVTQPLAALAGKVILQDGYTLRSFLSMVRRYPDFQAISVFIPPLLDECAKYRDSGCVTDMLTHLELVKRVEMIGFPGEPRFNILCALTGRYKEQEQELRLFQLDNLLDMPVRLGLLKHSVFGDSVNIMEFETDYTLFEFIEGIAWEFGFQRFPEHCSIRG